MTELLSIIALVFSAIALLHTLTSSAGDRVIRGIDSCFDTLSTLIAAESEIADLNKRLKSEIIKSSGKDFAKNSGILASLDDYENRVRKAREGLTSISESTSYVYWFLFAGTRVAHFQGTVSTCLAFILRDAKYGAEHYPGVRERALEIEATMNAFDRLKKDSKTALKR